MATVDPNDPQAVWDAKHPKGPEAPAVTQNAAPVQNVAPVDPNDPQAVWDAKNPKPAVTDTQLENLNPWEKPAGTSWSDYAWAKAHKMAGALQTAGSEVGRAYTDDYTMGTADIARSQETGEPLAKVRADTEAAKADIGASRYGVAAMAALTPNPVGWAAKGLRIANAIEQPIVNVVGPLGRRVASGIGRFFEGGAYTGAQDVGHGQTQNLPLDVLGGGAFTAGLGSIGDAIPAAGKWARTQWTGSPEATPADITNANVTAQSPNTNNIANAQQLDEWQSNNALGRPPSQSEVEAHARSLYGPRMDQWPPELRDLYNATGSGATKGMIARVLSYAGAHAVAGATDAAQSFMGGVDPTLAATAHTVAQAAGDYFSPMVESAIGGTPSVGQSILNSYPALTGYRVAPSMPSQQGLTQDWTKLVTGLANPSTPRQETVTPGWYGPY